MIPEFPNTKKFPYTSEAEYGFHTPEDARVLRAWLADTRDLNDEQSWHVAKLMYVMRKAGYSLDEIRVCMTSLLPRVYT